MKREMLHLAKRAIKATPLYWIYSKVGEHFQRKLRTVRDKQEARLPNTSLSQAHVESCELLADRSVLLSRLPNNGVVAEIGVSEGDFSSEILSRTDPDTLHLIDWWKTSGHSHGFEMVQSRFESEIEKEKVEVHRGLSTDVADHFPANYFDWIYIDTDHSYETTRDELQKYAPKVKSGGIIAGHDYMMANWKGAYRYGVVEAVHEFCECHDWKLIYLTADVNEHRSFAIQSMEA